MEFRWVAGLTLWTMLSGPILSQPAPPRTNVVLARPAIAKPKSGTTWTPISSLSHAHR